MSEHQGDGIERQRDATNNPRRAPRLAPVFAALPRRVRRGLHRSDFALWGCFPCPCHGEYVPWARMLSLSMTGGTVKL